MNNRPVLSKKLKLTEPQTASTPTNLIESAVIVIASDDEEAEPKAEPVPVLSQTPAKGVASTASSTKQTSEFCLDENPLAKRN